MPEQPVKPKLPEDKERARKIKSLVFWGAILLMLGSSAIFLWKAFSGNKSSAPKQEQTQEESQSSSSQTTKEEQVSGQKYTVKEGDTLFKIAKQFNVTTNDIVKANKLESADKISIGQELIIPEKGSGESSPTNTGGELP